MSKNKKKFLLVIYNNNIYVITVYYTTDTESSDCTAFLFIYKNYIYKQIMSKQYFKHYKSVI